MTIEKVKSIINETAKKYEIEKYNYIIDEGIYENDKYYMFSFSQDIEEPMDGMLFLIEKSTEKVIPTDYISIPVSVLNSMKEIK